MNIIHSANAYRDYVWYHKIYNTWYENELVCGHDRDDDSLFCWRHDMFICRECKFKVYIEHDRDLTTKQQTQIVEHIKSNHFVLIRLNPFQKNKGVAENKENKPRIIVKGARFRHPLKPWKDPESLFCDTEFLKTFISSGSRGRENSTPSGLR